MARSLGTIRFRITPSGKIVSSRPDNSTTFDSFLHSVDPEYVRTRPEPKRAEDQDRYGTVINKVANLADQAHFCVRNRKGKHLFSFGFDENNQLALATILNYFYKGDAKAPLEEKIASILKANPSMYEVEPLEDGTRVFCRPHGNYNKAGWSWKIGDGDIIAHRGPKTMTQASGW